MSDNNGIPIFDVKSGKTSFAKPAPRPEQKRDVPLAEAAITSAPIDTPAAVDGSEKTVARKGKPGKQKVEIGSLLDLFTQAYAAKGRKLTLMPTAIKQVASNCRMDEAQRQSVLRLAESDPQLSVPRQLLLLARSVDGFPALRTAIREVVRDILLGHEICKGPIVSSLLMRPSEGPTLASALGELQQYQAAADSKAERESEKPSTQQLKENACSALALWLAEANGLALARVVEGLYSAIWEPAANRLGSEGAKWRMLTDIKDGAAVGLACEVFRREASEQWQRSQKAADDVREMAGRIEALEAENEALRTSLRQTEARWEAETGELRQRMADLQSAAEIEAVHQRDDQEQIRARLLRRLKADLANLEEGLTALRRPEPKVHVMVDIAERVTDAMRKEIRNLQGEE